MADFQESRGVTPVNGTDDREARSNNSTYRHP